MSHLIVLECITTSSQHIPLPHYPPHPLHSYIIINYFLLIIVLLKLTLSDISKFASRAITRYVSYPIALETPNSCVTPYFFFGSNFLDSALLPYKSMGLHLVLLYETLLLGLNRWFIGLLSVFFDCMMCYAFNTKF